jgi:F0F1-type ATP synthase assembly protein I
MLKPEEKAFVDYWQQNRDRKKKVIGQLSVGLPLAVALVLAIFVNFFAGWYKRAEMMVKTEPSVIIVLLIAAILIVIFIVIFSVRHKWDLNEQRYRELLAKNDD